MEQSYAEANAKVKTSISSILTKALCIIVILALFALSFMGVRYVMIVAGTGWISGVVLAEI